MSSRTSFTLSLFLLLAALVPSKAQVVINEIHYHPVEKPAFDIGGNPIFAGTGTAADLADDVHEFIELTNVGASPVSLAGYKLTGGINFTFPAGTSIATGGYLVVAKNPARIQTVYSIAGVLGPWVGKLGNNGDTVRLENTGGTTIDSASYSASFPWAISANGLGANDDFTGLSSANYQYKGRSLQRVSPSASSNDPANWLAVRPAVAATFADLPTPRAANIVTRAVPKPAVVGYSVVQLSDNAATIRASQQVKIACNFSSSATLSSVQVEYFLENMNAFGETRTTVAMTTLGNNQYSATLPGQIDRTIVRWRIKADRGDGVELVFPRPDDPAVVQVGAPTYPSTPAPPTALPKVSALREAWSAYFVTPVRSSVKPIYDVIIPTDGSLVDDNAANNTMQFNGVNGLQALAFNCKGGPKRTTAENTASSYPRETPYQLSSARIWNDVVPGVFATNGVIRDIVIRYHGSRWSRRPLRKSFKVFFADYTPFIDGAGNAVTQLFETDKSDMFMTGQGLHQLAGLPISTVRYVDWYFNSDAKIDRLEQGEYNGELLDAYHEKMQRLSPGSAKEETGDYYKAVGFIVGDNLNGEGPYGNGNGWKLPAAGFWTELQRFDYTFALQNHHWKGAKPMMDLINGMWAARGDTHTAPAPNIPALRTWLETNWDVEAELTSLALGNWMCPWDDTTQNHFLWRRANGKWVRTLWDFDNMYGGGAGAAAQNSIYLGEVSDPGNNFRGPNYVKDSFLKAFRTEYKARLWFLTNTLLDPDNLQVITYKNVGGTSTSYFSYINAQSGGFAVNRFNTVNTLTALGTFYKPTRPTNTAPTVAAAVLPGANLQGSAYGYNAAYTHAAAPSTSPHTSSKWEIRTAASTYDDPIHVGTSTTALTSLAIPFGQLTYGQTYFWRVTYYDALGHPSITSAETSFSYGPTSITAGNVTLNEIMAENITAVANAGDHPDYIELKNNTAAIVDLSGWNLTDDELIPTLYTFPAGTLLPASGYLIVWCDSATTPGLHTGFGLSKKGQRVILLQNGIVKDAISFGPQAQDSAIGRFTDGTGAWTLVNATPAAVNTARAFGTSATNVKFNEWMAAPRSGSDWFELFNAETTPLSIAGLWLSGEPAIPKTTQIPALSFIGAKGVAKFDANDSIAGFSGVNFKLSSGGDTVLLSTNDGLTALGSITFGAQQPNVSQGRFPDGTATILPFPLSPSPGDNNWLPAQVVINEALTNSTAPFDDAIELFNTSASPVDIGGWWLSDDHFALQKYQIAPGTIIPPGGYVVFYENQFNPTPGAGNSFSLSATGDELVLSATDGVGVPNGYRSQVSFGPAADGISFGRVLTGSPAGTQEPEFWPMIARTFGQDSAATNAIFHTGLGLTNSAPKTGPIVINEVMYHPTDLPGPLDNTRDEFIELHNITTNSVNVSGWKLKADADFLFPASTFIRPGDYVLVVGFNPATDPASLAAFRAAYGLAANVPIFGPYTPKLSNSSSDIELAYPGPAIAGVVPFILVDKIIHDSVAPWPVAPDGTGPALQRISRTAIGNDVANWASATATPAAVNSGQTPIADSDGDGIPDGWETANGFDKFNDTDATLDSDGDGQNNLAEFLAGTAPHSSASVFKTDVAKIAGGFHVQFPGKTGKSYTIQYRDSLTAGNWLRLQDVPTLAVDQTITASDITAAPNRFYRTITPLQP